MRCCLQGLALIDEADRLGGEGLLAKIQVGELRLGPQDVPARGLGPLDAKLQLLAALVDCAAAFLAGFIELPQAQAQAPQALLALGQLDLGFRRIAIAGLPLAFQPGNLLLETGQAGLHLGQAGLVSLAFFAGFGQPRHGGIVLHRGGPEFAVQGRPLLLELGPALLGGRQLETMVGQRFARLAMGGRVMPDLLLPLGDLGLHLVDGGFGGGDPRVEASQLLVQLPQLAAARNQPLAPCRGPTTSVPSAWRRSPARVTKCTAVDH